MSIELNGDDFIVAGYCAKSRMEAVKAAEARNGLKKFIDMVADKLIKPPVGEPDLELVPFSRSYSSADIDRLEQEAANRRGDPSGMPDIYSLGERLRTIGRVIDGSKGRMVRLFKDLHRIIFEYRDADGTLHKEELDNTGLYQLQQRYAAGRSATSGE